MDDKTLGAYNIFDLRDMARRRLPKFLFEYVDRGSEDEVALRNNRAAFERIKLRPRTLVDVSARTPAVTLFGRQHDMPLAIAPTGTAGLMWYRGEIALARAARAAGIPFTLATSSLSAIETVASEAGGTLWMQLYSMWPDRTLSYEIVERARVAGFDALIFTVDSIVSPNREYNIRNGLRIPFRFSHTNVADVLCHPRWMLEVLGRYLLTTGMPRYENYPAAVRSRVTAIPKGEVRVKMKNESLNWDDLRALRERWPRTLIVKGILHADDARRAVDLGADAVVVSNHGARNLDATPAPIEVLPEIVDAVGNRTTVMVDGGFRRGSDVVKALALGAKAVLVGRGTLYGTAAGGEAGAARALALYREEIDRVMALTGVRTLAELGPQYLHCMDRVR